MKCNGCWQELEPTQQAVATSCFHLFCLKCAQTIIQSDSPLCHICQSLISKSNIKLVNVLQDSGGLKLALCGQTPETILTTALSAVNFYVGQIEVLGSLQEAKLTAKVGKVQEACKRKLQEVHAGFTNAKRKYQEASQLKHNLEADVQELQQKYQQKSAQARKLQEMVQKVQKENELLRQGLGGHNRLDPRMDSSHPGGPNVVTTVHRKQVYVPSAGLASPNFLGQGAFPHQGLAGSQGRAHSSGGYGQQHQRLFAPEPQRGGMSLGLSGQGPAHMTSPGLTHLVGAGSMGPPSGPGPFGAHGRGGLGDAGGGGLGANAGMARQRPSVQHLLGGPGVLTSSRKPAFMGDVSMGF